MNPQFCRVAAADAAAGLYVIGRIPPGKRGHRRLPQQALELLGIEPVTADHRAIEKQDGDMESIAPNELGIAVHVHDADRRQRYFTSEGIKLGHHLVAQVTILPVHHGERRLAQ